MSSTEYPYLKDGYNYYSPVLGKYTSDYFNTYFGPGYYDPGQQCFCQDGCPDSRPSCGKCASQQFCTNCNMQLSAYCPSYPYYGGLGWL